VLHVPKGFENFPFTGLTKSFLCRISITESRYLSVFRSSTAFNPNLVHENTFPLKIWKRPQITQITFHQKYTMDQATFDTIAVMKRQEAHYTTTENLYEGRIADVQCRSLMVDWCFSVADFFEYSRSTVHIAINCLDRYLAKRSDVLDGKRVFQLIAMTCFYTAVKIHESVALNPSMVAQLSKGIYTEKEVETVEADILMTLSWRVNPPIAASFAMSYLKLFPESSVDVKDIINRQLDFAVKDSCFLGTDASSIAFAAVMNAVEQLDSPISVFREVGFVMCEALGADRAPFECAAIREHFKTVVEFKKLRSRPAVNSERRPSEQMRPSSEQGLSPRCVTMQRRS
jgi:hypothetical protein